MAEDTPLLVVEGTEADPRVNGQRVTSWRDLNLIVQQLMLERGEYGGVPFPVEGLCLEVEDRDRFAGNREFLDQREAATPLPPAVLDQMERDQGLQLRNRWDTAGRDIILVGRDSRATEALKIWNVPAPAIVDKLLRTFSVCEAWDIEAEAKAMDKLGTLIGAHRYKQYLFTGAFLETSRKSGVTYLFRRLRPTLALKAGHSGLPPWPKEEEPPLRILAALCLHPIGWYRDTYAGVMVPTDDVLAHLILMRGDERRFWSQANQHPAHAWEYWV